MSAELSAPSPPPPYSLSDPRSHRLKECFTSLLGKQSQIQTLFDVVAERLQQLGAHHPLVEEWSTLRQVHKQTYKNSQEQAGRCADFLAYYLEVVVPLSESDVSLAQKRELTRHFLDAIDKYRVEARECSTQFDGLTERINRFRINCGAQRRVARGFCATIKEYCAALCEAVSALLNHFVTLVRRLLSGLRNMHIELGPLRVDAHFDNSEYSRLLEEYEMRPRPPTSEIEAAVLSLQGKVGGFEDAWDAVRKSCDTLQTQLGLVQTVAAPPAYYELCLEKARGEYMLLYECMSAYSQGRAPLI